MRNRCPLTIIPYRKLLLQISKEIEGDILKSTPSVFPFKRGRTPWMETNHAESPSADAGGDSGGEL